MADDALTRLVTALSGVAKEIRRIETDALATLHGRGDDAFYRKRMREKAEVLQYLPKTMGSFVEQLPLEEREEINYRLDKFSMSASTALKLDSIFYMSALLYPEDYREGEPNDLERFISELERSRE
ncbi:hypothetical protein SAMN05660653_01692 [Desulfonatronum thiosulfatophilum]|uniref:Uncharacterized protein n=1 Tax=Desulfonatronum thiosulfatophilum TaxID=617002 RepID=A0A1G6CSV2_9BACT|nr:hypothetical protein [Desulfonatronum thiosulfatophilum]SDB35976.1 hypothetical protein SAMN05660653_01692 [Desulfonatronum thiosulfatophilum]